MVDGIYVTYAVQAFSIQRTKAGDVLYLLQIYYRHNFKLISNEKRA